MTVYDGFGDQGWFDAWYEAFAPTARRHPLPLGGRDFQPDLMEATVTVLRRPWKFLRAPVNVHAPLYGWKLAERPRPEALDRTLRSLLGASGAHGLELKLLPEASPTLDTLRELAAGGAWLCSVGEAGEMQVVDTEGEWAPYWAGLSGDFRRHLNKQERQLGAVGRVEFHDAAETGSWPEELEQALALEAAGWKGEAGSAILKREPEAQFYRRVAESAAGKRRLRLFTLSLNGRVVASYLMIADGGALFALKTAYDEGLGRYGTGVLLLRWALMECFRDPAVSALVIPGAPSWTRRWASRAERLVRARLVPTRSLAALAISAETRARRLRGWITNRSLGRR